MSWPVDAILKKELGLVIDWSRVDKEKYLLAMERSSVKDVGNNAKQYLLEHFRPDTIGVDIMISYPADDSYFSFSEGFINNTICTRHHQGGYET